MKAVNDIQTSYRFNKELVLYDRYSILFFSPFTLFSFSFSFITIKVNMLYIYQINIESINNLL